MLTYYNPIKDRNGYVYSVDMIRLTFTMPTDEKARQALACYFSRDGRADIDIYPTSTKSLKYRNLVVIDYETTSATYGFGFNGPNRDDMLKGFVEFNPNKTMNGRREQFLADLDYLRMSVVGLTLARYDLAIDVPIARGNLALHNPKGKVYRLERYSADNVTEWLGRRNVHGYTKLYNKALESKTDADGVMLTDLSRVEITLETTDILEAIKELPAVTIKRNVDMSDLTKAWRLLAVLLKEKSNPQVYLEQLDYRSREKLKPYVFGDVRLDFDKLCISAICKSSLDWLGTSVSVKQTFVKDGWVKVELDHTPFVE